MESRENLEEKGINLLELVHVLVRRKMLIVKICSFAVVASVAYSLSLPNIYSATAKVLPPQKETGGGLSALLGQAGSVVNLATGGLGGGSDLFVAILKSRSVADGVVQRADVAAGFKNKLTPEAARESVAGALKVQAGKDGVISITASDRSPKRAALIANAFVDELGKATVRLNLSKAGTERVFLEKRLELVKRDLQAAEEDLKAFSQSNKIVQVESQNKASIENLARMKAELATKEVQLAILRSKMTEQSPEVKALVTGISRLKTELSSLSGVGGGEGIPSLGNVPGVSLEYARKLRLLKTQESIHEQLTKQYEMVKLSEAKDSSSLQVLDLAVAPEKKSTPKRSQIVILATMSSFFISVFIVLLQEYYSRMSESDKKILQNIKTVALELKWR